MKVSLELRPGSAVAKVELAPGGKFTAEGGSMIAMSADMEIETARHKSDKGGVIKALKRMASGEGFFMNHYTAGHNGGEVWLSTSLPGDILQCELNNERIFVQSGAFVASSSDIDLEFKWEGLKGLLGGEGLFWLVVGGTGTVLFNTFGALYKVEVDGEYIVDSSHIVAYTEGLEYGTTKAGKSWISSFMGGEGLVSKFKGRGTVWCQSHSPSSFGGALTTLLKPKKR